MPKIASKIQSKEKIKDKVINGLSVLLLREAMMKIFAIIGQLLLVKLLLPEYFGVFAIFVFIMNSAELFSDIGFSQAIIQKKKSLNTNELSLIFYIKIALASIVYILIFLLSPFILLLFNDLPSNSAVLVRLFSLIILVKPYKSMLVALLERRLEFSKVALIDVSGILAYYLVAVFLASMGWGVLSLIISVIFKEIAECLIAFSINPWLPGKISTRKSILKIIHFGKFVQIGSIITHIHNSSIPVIAGMTANPMAVGLLNFSSNALVFPNSLAQNFGRVALPGFSRIQEDKALLSRSIKKSITLLNLLIFLFIVMVFGYSYDFMKFFLNPVWLSALPALYWFVAGSFFYGSTVTLAHAILALGKSKDLVFIGGLSVVCEWIASLILIAFFGYTALAIGIFCGIVIQFFGFIYILRKLNVDTISIGKFVGQGFVLFATLLSVMVLKILFSGSILALLIEIPVSISIYYVLSTKICSEEVNYLKTLILRVIKSHIKLLK